MPEATEYKTTLVEHLKTKHIGCVHSLWGEAKTFYKDKLIPMGGAYASWGDTINVTLNVDGEMIRFKVSIEEARPKTK